MSVVGVCQTCRMPVEVEWRDKAMRAAVEHVCAKKASESPPIPLPAKGLPAAPNAPRSVASRAAESSPRGPNFSNAKKTTCAAGHRHASGMEAKVCQRLTAEYAADPLHRLVQQVRLPLLRLAEADGRLKSICVDFGVIHKNEEYPGLMRLVEAKNPKRVSRDWPARKRACELSWGVTIEEVSS